MCKILVQEWTNKHPHLLLDRRSTFSNPHVCSCSGDGGSLLSGLTNVALGLSSLPDPPDDAFRRLPNNEILKLLPPSTPPDCGFEKPPGRTRLRLLAPAEAAFGTSGTAAAGANAVTALEVGCGLTDAGAPQSTLLTSTAAGRKSAEAGETPLLVLVVMSLETFTRPASGETGVHPPGNCCAGDAGVPASLLPLLPLPAPTSAAACKFTGALTSAAAPAARLITNGGCSSGHASAAAKEETCVGADTELPGDGCECWSDGEGGGVLAMLSAGGSNGPLVRTVSDSDAAASPELWVAAVKATALLLWTEA